MNIIYGTVSRISSLCNCMLQQGFKYLGKEQKIIDFKETEFCCWTSTV